MLDPLDNNNRPYLSALDKKRRKAFRVLVFESIILHSWRLFFWILLFFGLWTLSLPSFFGQSVSIITSLIFLFGLTYLVKKDIFSFHLPETKDIDHRLEKNSALPRGQISIIEDHLANPKKHETRDLWNIAQKQSLLSFKRLKSPRVKSLISREDPSALRYIAILLFISGLMFSGNLWKEKIVSGLIPFSPSYVISGGQSTNLWIKPPEYTQIEPIHLTDNEDDKRPINIPEDSNIRIRIYSSLGTYFPPYLRNGKKVEKLNHIGDGLYGIKTTIEDGKSLSITQWFIPRASWAYNFIKDLPPEIISDVNIADKDGDVVIIEDELPPLPFEEESTEEPKKAQANNDENKVAEIKDEDPYEVLDNYQIRFPLIVKDDYGVKELRMTMDIDEMVEEKPLGEKAQETRLIMSQPEVEFKISPIYDLTWHTWAGLPVTFTYEAIDHKGQIAKTDKIKLVLPERKFEHPMAKSLIAMRKRLAWDYKDSFIEIAQNLETLLDAPDYFQNDPVIYLAIKISSARLYFNDNADKKQRIKAAKEVINLLWYTALSIEEGDISLAKRELHEAQRALENALRDPNASDDEISQLMDNLRNKMANYFAEMQRDLQKRMENGENFPEFSADNFDDIISPDTLSKMMEEIEQAMRDGDEQKAQELMSQLQRMMEMMDSSKMARLPKDMQTMREGINELQQLIERQEALMEQTQKQANKQEKAQWQEQQKKQSTVTPRSLPTLEQMLKDFGMENAPPAPKNDNEEDSKQSKQEEKNSDSSKSQTKQSDENENKEKDGQKENAQSQEQEQADTKQKGDNESNKGISNDNSKQSDETSTALNKAEQDALRYILGQLMMDAAEDLDEVPEKMGMAEQEMRKSAKALGNNDPRGSLPNQEKAIQYLKDGQEELAKQFKQRMKQMVGIGMSGGGSQKYDPLGRRYSDEEDKEGKSAKSKVQIPDELDKKRVDEIIKKLRDRSSDRSRSRDELDYFRRLLRQF